MLSRWVYILLGNDKTGKTTFQKKVIKYLCGINKDNRLDTNSLFDISHPYAIRKLRNIFVINRSYQEIKSPNDSMQGYFKKHFKDADICILSSHLDINDISAMIDESHKKFYNVGGIFWSNSLPKYQNILQEIALLNWDERFWFENPLTKAEDKATQEEQIDTLAYEFVQMLVNRATNQ